MPNQLPFEFRLKTWLMYLRKSRQDNPDESVEEVLAKHETILQEWARRELGREIPEDCIYREVVSGESLNDRIEIKKVLSRIEDACVAGVIVVEPQRLSRGDLEDCGKLISTLQYTNTLVATPMMIYSMDNKMERRFFQDELMRGRDYLEYTKEILLRGRIAAVKKGCYISVVPPYGYDKLLIGKDHTLTPNDNADVVRLIFDLYVNHDKSFHHIACHLNKMNIPAPMGGIWRSDTIRVILKNVHYIGKVSFNKIKKTTVVENGERVIKRLTQPPDEVIIAEGKHPAIVDLTLFQKAQEKRDAEPRKKRDTTLHNVFSGLLFCEKCGRAIMRHPYKHSEARMECRSSPKCYKTAKYSEVEQAVISTLECSELPKLRAMRDNKAGDSIVLQKRLLEHLEKQMDEYRQQEDKQYDLLETGVYTQALFDRRNTVLRQKIDECQAQIRQAKAAIPKSIDYDERITELEQAIEILKISDISIERKNKFLKRIIERIDYSTGESSYNHTEIILDIILRL